LFYSEKSEPKNGHIFLHNCQLFSRICGRDSHILDVTAMFAERAASLDSTNSAYMVEVGYQYLLRGRTKVRQLIFLQEI
jgi:tetratricopeptide repeat protein 21B